MAVAPLARWPSSHGGGRPNTCGQVLATGSLRPGSCARIPAPEDAPPQQIRKDAAREVTDLMHQEDTVGSLIQKMVPMQKNNICSTN